MQNEQLNILQEKALIDRFNQRSKLYIVFNIILILWTLTQIGLYGHEVALTSSSCQQAANLGIGYLVNYSLYFFVPILVIFCIRGKQIIPITIIYCALNIICKIIILILLFTIAWKHIGLCYISFHVKSTIIANSVIQLVTLMVQIWLLSRIRFIQVLQKRLNMYGLTVTSEKPFDNSM